MHKKLRVWLPPITWAVLIFTLSSIPSLKASDNTLLQNIINITGHFFEYFVLALLLARALFSERIANSLPLAAYLSTIYALSDELHQSLVPGRVADLKDIAIDILGVLTAIWWLTNRRGTINR